jgi:predicted kinase
MATLFLLCGLPGAGKTTLAKRLEQERSALRFTPDDWIAALGIDAFDEDKRATVEAIQWSLAERALSIGTNLVIDFGVWSRQECDRFRMRAEAVGAKVELHFLDVPRHELWTRLTRRGGRLPSEEVFDYWCDELFERPTADEFW